MIAGRLSPPSFNMGSHVIDECDKHEQLGGHYVAEHSVLVPIFNRRTHHQHPVFFHLSYVAGRLNCLVGLTMSSLPTQGARDYFAKCFPEIVTQTRNKNQQPL